MASQATNGAGDQQPPQNAPQEPIPESEKLEEPRNPPKWRRLFGGAKQDRVPPVVSESSSDAYVEVKARPEKWSMGVLNDKETDEVPGKVTQLYGVDN